MPWGNEKHMRETIRLRRGLCDDLRKAGHKWHEIAELLSYGSAQHARLDWLRMKRPAKISKRFTGRIDKCREGVAQSGQSQPRSM